MNLNRLRTKLARLNLTDAAREAAAIKAEFRREEDELIRTGRTSELLAQKRKVFGATAADRARLVTINGVPIKS